MEHLEISPTSERNVSACKKRQNCWKHYICLESTWEVSSMINIARPYQKPAAGEGAFPDGRAPHPYLTPPLASHYCPQGTICVTGNFQILMRVFILVLFGWNTAHWCTLCKVSKDCDILPKMQRDTYRCLLSEVSLKTRLREEHRKLQSAGTVSHQMSFWAMRVDGGTGSITSCFPQSMPLVVQKVVKLLIIKREEWWS